MMKYKIKYNKIDHAELTVSLNRLNIQLKNAVK